MMFRNRANIWLTSCGLSRMKRQARTNLRQLLHNLRRALPVDCSLLVADNHSVHWKADKSCAIDVMEFKAAVQAAASAKESDVAAAREALEEAARLYQDDLLPDLYDEWLEPIRAQLRQQFADVLSRLAGLLETLGEYPAGILHATRLVALDPLRESYYQTLMRLHLRNHDRSSALRVYHQCMRTLQRELGVSPRKSMQEMLKEALNSEELSSVPAELPPYAATKPLPMVGRRMEWERLQDCWRRVTEGEAHFALIMGEPGIGKSRLAEKLFDWCARNPKEHNHPRSLLLCPRAARVWAHHRAVAGGATCGRREPNFRCRNWQNWRACCRRFSSKIRGFQRPNL